MVVGVLAFTGVLIALWLGVQSLTNGRAEWVQAAAGNGFRIGCFIVLIGGAVAWYWWSRQRKIVVSVTSDGLTVNTRPGEVYSFGDAKLGTWGMSGGMTMGTALHLHCGSRRFILGGRDHRVARGTRLDAPDVGYGLPVDIDASVSAPEFEEILAAASGRGALDVREPAAGEPTHCLLFANPLLVQEIGWFSMGKKKQFLESIGQPRLAIDVGAEAIRVIDPNTNEVIASVPPAQVTAAPVMYRPSTWHSFWASGGSFLSDLLGNYWGKMPYMVVTVPGLQPLTIGCRDSVSGINHRFWWSDDVPMRADERAHYVVSGADWLTVVEKFGLAPHLKQKGVAH
ncbi:hypothetical protein [Mycolicibacterium sp. HK-90]|uniref:hypothetical protein n=1 Tax=Mycolicibacterium sp. HK-90 TaxID=3056937 RepID=UPI00265A7164|nr:hypothetical protein [Mycolicibacterium sp. HK-90]WKG02281.1 hypothetical protein QU592_24120 [Mycolicibacterium sp. HK-90]